MPEQVFLNEGGVQVTNARFIAKGRTFAINGITSVTLYKKGPSLLGPILILFFAVAVFLHAPDNPKAGIASLVMIVIVIIYWIFDNTYAVRLMTASGESDAFSSRKRDQIQRIVRALNEAIIARG